MKFTALPKSSRQLICIHSVSRISCLPLAKPQQRDVEHDGLALPWGAFGCACVTQWDDS